MSTWAPDAAAQMHVRLVRHVSSSGRIRVLATSLDQSVASMSALADLYHGRWRIEEARVCLKHRLGLESVIGLSQHALLVEVATKVLADNLAALLNRSVALPEPADEHGVRRKVNRAQANERKTAHASASQDGFAGALPSVGVYDALATRWSAAAYSSPQSPQSRQRQSARAKSERPTQR